MPSPPVSDEVRAEVLRLAAVTVADGKRKWTMRQIAYRAKCSLGLVNKIINHPDAWVAPREAMPEETPAEVVARHRAREAAEAARREHIDAVKQLSFRQWLEATIDEKVTPVPRLPAPPPAKLTKRAHERFPLLVLTDWHFEEKVKPAGVLGLNAYDVATACRRVYRVVRCLIDWKRNQEAGGRFAFPKLAVLLNGDFLTGDLHGSNKFSDSPNTVRAALSCGDLLGLALADLAREFPAVEVIGTYGNHGRMPDKRKVPTKNPTESWDFLVYQVARRRLAEQRGVAWHLPDAYGVLFEVGGQQCYAAHGNFIPNNLGVVGYGVRRFTSSLGSNLSAGGKPLRYAFFGHWHQSSSAEFAGIEAFIGPSLIGTQEFSFLSGGAVNRSAQEMHVFDRTLGHVTRERLYGDGPGYDGAYEVEI